MARVTGLGCTASALCGAFAAVRREDIIRATASAMAVMGIAGETAARADGPGSMQVMFLDALYGLTRRDIEERLKLTVQEL